MSNWTQTGIRLLATAVFIFSALRAAEAGEPASPLSAADEEQTFRLADERLMVELVAAEPEVIDPVACAWSEDGRLYVAQMHDYPVGQMRGSIKLLEDRDRDGRYEQATVFAKGLAFPNSVLAWRGGIFVTAAPDLLYLKDTDGDGVADERRVVFTGFGEGNQQLRANGLTWGVDGWIYGANGRSDGEVRRPQQDEKTWVSLRRHDFRFDPDTEEFQAIAGFSQFGLARDDWGNRFLSWNTMPFRHVVIEEADLARNPNLLTAGSVTNLIAPTDDARLYPISATPQTFNRESVRHFNASCGVTIYRGVLLGDEYFGNALVCEPLTNLVHRLVLEPHGSTFVARRAESESQREFLASTDPWFRPVYLANGPEGALYVVDFYRKWVEHPQFVAAELRDDVDFRTGEDRGRLWRIRRRDVQPGSRPNFSGEPMEWIPLLESANGWTRDTAQRLLIERHDSQTFEPLRALVLDSPSEPARIAALWTLERLGACDDSLLERVLEARSPRVREQALRLAARRLVRSPTLVNSVLKMTDEMDSRAQLALTIALANATDSRSLERLAQLCALPEADEWLQSALLSGLHNRELACLQQIMTNSIAVPPKMLVELAALIGRRNVEQELRDCLALRVGSDEDRESRLLIVSGLARGLASVNQPVTERLVNCSPGEQIPELVKHAALVAKDDNTALDVRVRNVELLGHLATGEGRSLVDLLGTSEPLALQVAAVRAIANSDDTELSVQAVAKWPQLSVMVRHELVATMSRRPQLAAIVARGIEEDLIAATDLDAGEREQLLRAIEPASRASLEQLLPEPAADRAQVVRQYQAALERSGNARHGAELFVMVCAACHNVHGKGARVGPELTGIGSRPSASLLTDILDPSRDVAPDFVNFLVETVDGRVLSGILANESAAAIVLRGSEGVEDLIARDHLARLQSTGKSLMPEGLEQRLTVGDMADLLAFLRQPRAELLPVTGR